MFFLLGYFTVGSTSLGDTLKRSVLLLGAILAGFGFVLLLPGAADALWAYFELQIKASVLAENTTYHHRSNRLYIIRRTIEVIIPAVIIGALVVAIAYRKSKSLPWTGSQQKWAILFMLVGVSASFPLAISPKQAYYYLLPSMPYFALAIGIISAQPVAKYLKGMPGRIESGILVMATLGLLLFAAYNTYQHWGEITRRDRSVLTDIERVNNELPARIIIGGKGKIAPLVSYMYRLKSISIDTAVVTAYERDFLIAPDTIVVDSTYQQIETGAVNYVLYRKSGE
jgi:hypothetical protein